MEQKLSDNSSSTSGSSLLVAKHTNNNILQYRKQPIRWLALVLISLMILGRFYSSNTVPTLETQLKSIMGLTNLEYAWLNSVASFPNIILSFVFGALIDNYGARKGIICSTLMLAIAQIILMLGCYFNSYPLLLISQTLSGSGGFACVIAKVKMISIWFNDDGFAHALGWTLTASKFGDVLDSLITPRLYNLEDNLVLPTFGGLIVVLLSLTAGIGIVILDLKADANDKKNYSIAISETPSTVQIGERKDIIPEPTEHIGFKSLREFSSIAWLSTLIFAIGQGTGLTFSSVLNDLLQKRFEFANTTSGEMLAITYMISAALSPVTGIIIKLYGQRIRLLLLASACFSISLSLFIALPFCNSCSICYVPIVFLGIFITLFSTTSFSCLHLLVPKKMVALIIGAATAFLGISQAMFSLIFGVIADATIQINQGYFWSVVFILGLIGICTILIVITSKLDNKINHGLMNSTKKRSTILVMKS